jgi:hypothetical protein
MIGLWSYGEKSIRFGKMQRCNNAPAFALGGSCCWTIEGRWRKRIQTWSLVHMLNWSESNGWRSRGGMHGGAEEVALDNVRLADLLSGQLMNVGYTGNGPFAIPVSVASRGTTIR